VWGIFSAQPGIMLDLTGEPRLGVTRKTQEWNAMLIRPELAKVRMGSGVLQQKPNMGIGVQSHAVPWSPSVGFNIGWLQIDTGAEFPSKGDQLGNEPGFGPATMLVTSPLKRDDVSS
jgi:hypothetical protein